jgi:hypothetical protein
MSALARRLYAAWLRWCLACNEDYMRDCERVGIADTNSMHEWRKQAGATRVQIALLEA